MVKHRHALWAIVIILMTTLACKKYWSKVGSLRKMAIDKKDKKNYIMHWWPLTKWEKLHIFCAHLIIQNYVYLCTQSLQLSTGPFGPDICWEIENSEQRIFWYFWDMFTTITFQELELLTLIAWSSCIGFAHWLVSSIFFSLVKTEYYVKLALNLQL